MAATERLYLRDTYLFTCDATVVEVREDGVVLDQTVFHPQGGGQPSDVGELWRGGVLAFQVTSAKSDGTAVVHVGTVAPDAAPLQPGEKVQARVDEGVRRRSARLHSAGHALDAAMRNAGYDALKPSKGYHFSDGPYVEYEGVLPPEERGAMVERLNAEVKQLLAADISTRVRFDGAGTRTVSVGGCECACGGTHVARTGELAGMRVTKVKAKSGRTRVSYAVDGS